MGIEDKFASARKQMVSRDLVGKGITDQAVLQVMGEVPREEFASDEYKRAAYADRPLPIGMGQTISQPYIVALMTQQLKLTADMDVLELGTGCGYQTAVLSKLARRVYTIERLNQLSESAQAVLGRLKINNVEFYIGDGSAGWPEDRTFDRIIVTAAVPEVPRMLLGQLENGGLIIAPVGNSTSQKLMACEKKAVGCTEHVICDVRFVKLIGEYGFPE